MTQRAATPDDTATITGLAVSSGLFPAGGAGLVTLLMSDYFAGLNRRGHRCTLIIEQDAPIGVAYFQPAAATDRTWYLTMIAIAAQRQGRGYGTTLLRHVQDDLARDGQRLLLVETSGHPDFALTRHFYDRCGYTAVATVADYYEAGDDLVLFRRALGDL